MWIYLTLLVALIGLVTHAYASNPKVAQVGLVLFACGMLVFLFIVGGGLISLPPRHKP